MNRLRISNAQKWVFSGVMAATLSLVTSRAFAEQPVQHSAAKPGYGQEAGWITFAAGGAVLSGGVAALVMAVVKHGDLRDARRTGRPTSELEERRNAVDSYNLAGAILTGVGAVAIGTGVTLLVLDGRETVAEESMALRVVVNQVVLSGKF